MPKPLITSILFWTAVALQSAQAAGTDATVARDTQLLAGPSPELPLVATLPAGAEISVLGCLDDFSWCDVATAQDRGWVDADGISRPQDGGSIRRAGASTGIGVVDFDLLAYWAQHYSDQPWYGERARWRVNRQHWPQFPGQPPIHPQPPSPPPPPKPPAQPVMPSQPRP